MRVSEIRVKQIRVNQGLGVYYCFLLKWVDEYGNEKRQKRCDI